ncbi:hypothetical protein PHISCL_03728 [Aspergillus sclerotialis]|uniref:Uncharacterized protein n=1 Tax=Aspergillus sclerotialis TaxID=2070753 RepID=A0A3A2ZL91_9EURO|nr:hypothetical protein PHISCL_03728 [Aspergillus sclerotialis]
MVSISPLVKSLIEGYAFIGEPRQFNVAWRGMRGLLGTWTELVEGAADAVMGKSGQKDSEGQRRKWKVDEVRLVQSDHTSLHTKLC